MEGARWRRCSTLRPDLSLDSRRRLLRRSRQQPGANADSRYAGDGCFAGAVGIGDQRRQPASPAAWPRANWSPSLATASVRPSECSERRRQRLDATNLGGVEVDFDAVAAPLLYVQASQINAQVPYTVAGGAITQIAVQYQGQVVGSALETVAQAAPGLFPVAINQDGSINSSVSPAPAGSVVTLFGTGEGLTNGPTSRPARVADPSRCSRWRNSGADQSCRYRMPEALRARWGCCR